jgi:hypothetical protein
MKNLLFTLILVMLGPLVAIDLNLPASAVLSASSELTLLTEHPSSAVTNPAVFKSGISTSATYLFSLKELPVYNLQIASKYKQFGFVFSEGFLNHEFYTESISGFSAAYLHKNISVGLGIRYLWTGVSECDSYSGIAFDGGVLWKNDKISSALAIKNIFNNKLAEEQLPIFWLWETGFELTTKSKLVVGIEKQNSFDFCFKFGGNYRVSDLLTLIVSYQDNPSRIGCGFLIDIAEYNISYSARTHQHLSLTHYISVGYDF